MRFPIHMCGDFGAEMADDARPSALKSAGVQSL
jgi:hypothetical protein